MPLGDDGPFLALLLNSRVRQTLPQAGSFALDQVPVHELHLGELLLRVNILSVCLDKLRVEDRKPILELSALLLESIRVCELRPQLTVGNLVLHTLLQVFYLLLIESLEHEFFLLLFEHVSNPFHFIATVLQL